jgi:hypothetical protein
MMQPNAGRPAKQLIWLYYINIGSGAILAGMGKGWIIQKAQIITKPVQYSHKTLSINIKPQKMNPKKQSLGKLKSKTPNSGHQGQKKL